ncbi:MAG: three-Cys-motif partner protein TcmP [Alphaproteobacteria bacterium]
MQFDEIGYWSEIKHTIIKRYAAEYCRILRNDNRFKISYIDAFSGAGIHFSKESETLVPGSPLNALSINPPFHEFHFIDLNSEKLDFLRAQIPERSDVKLYNGDANEVLASQVLPQIKWNQYQRALCVLDPYGLQLDWRIIEMAGKSRSVEIFLNFPTMDMNRNALWNDPSKVPDHYKERMTRYWGDETWRKAAYTTQGNLFGYEEKAGNAEVAEAFRQRLKSIADFKYVPSPLPLRNSSGAIVYYLFFASQNDTGRKIVEHIFGMFRERGRN